MWIKFSILMLVALINISLGLIILLKNRNKDKSKLYFSLMCFSAGLWSISLSLMLLDASKNLYTYFVKSNYLFSTGIFISFLFFCEEFLYKVRKKIINGLIWMLSIITIFILSTNFLFQKIYYCGNLLCYTPNLIVHLIYGGLFFLVLIYSYSLLFYKFYNSYGVNKNRVLLIIVGTLISFILGIYFDWIILYLNQYYLFWLGPVFTIIMNFSIAYLLFKKD